MNKKQKETLMKLFNEQQTLNLELFKKEQEFFGDHMDYKSEKMDLEMSIYNSKRNLKEVKQNGKSML